MIGIARVGVRVATAVVGAGPAGLLFAIAARVLAAKRGEETASALAIRIYDKRASYARTHRLRMAPEAYRELARELDHPVASELLGFLEGTEFAPEVNVLEAHLSRAAADLGLEKEQLSVGSAEGETSLAELRTRTLRCVGADDDALFTIVAADSVHSAVRELVRGDTMPTRVTHERIARVRVVGEGLARRLGALDRLRLSKVLGSVVDYRLNSNGFAEVDLFLTEEEFALVSGLGATPRAPVPLSAELLARLRDPRARAPMFSAIVEHLAADPAGRRREVLLQSSFRLEHAVMPTLVFEDAATSGPVFLVGDAGISLPFQRGMSCLARCALHLARAHVALVSAPPSERRRIGHAYDGAAASVLREELQIVRSRASLVRTLREIVRVSALLPFPIQSWWLSAGKKARARDRLSIWFAWNVGVAATVLAASALAYFVAWPWVIAALGSAVLGGVAYHAAVAFEGGAHRGVRRVWEVTIASLLVGGVGLAARDGVTAGAWLTPAPVFWFVAGAFFVAGLYVFERWVVRWFTRAGLAFRDDDAPR